MAELQEQGINAQIPVEQADIFTPSAKSARRASGRAAEQGINARKRVEKPDRYTFSQLDQREGQVAELQEEGINARIRAEEARLDAIAATEVIALRLKYRRARQALLKQRIRPQAAFHGYFPPNCFLSDRTKD